MSVPCITFREIVEILGETFQDVPDALLESASQQIIRKLYGAGLDEPRLVIRQSDVGSVTVDTAPEPDGRRTFRYHDSLLTTGEPLRSHANMHSPEKDRLVMIIAAQDWFGSQGK